MLYSSFIISIQFSLLAVQHQQKQHKKENIIQFHSKRERNPYAGNRKSGRLTFFLTSLLCSVCVRASDVVRAKWLYEIFHRHMNDNAGNHLNLTCFSCVVAPFPIRTCHYIDVCLTLITWFRLSLSHTRSSFFFFFTSVRLHKVLSKLNLIRCFSSSMLFRLLVVVISFDSPGRGWWQNPEEVEKKNFYEFFQFCVMWIWCRIRVCYIDFVWVGIWYKFLSLSLSLRFFSFKTFLTDEYLVHMWDSVNSCKRCFFSPYSRFSTSIALLLFDVVSSAICHFSTVLTLVLCASMSLFLSCECERLCMRKWVENVSCVEKRCVLRVITIAVYRVCMVPSSAMKNQRWMNKTRNKIN